MRQPLLQIGSFPGFVQAMIDSRFTCHDLAAVQACPRLQQQIRGIITRSNFEVPESVFNLLPHLGVIATYGVGYDRIPVEQARARHIQVAHTPGVLERSLALFTVGLTLSLLHRIPMADRFVRESQWPAGEMPMGAGLVGKTVGIFGLGGVGKEIAQAFRALGACVAYHGRQRQAVGLPFQPTLLGLAECSDILIVAAAANPQTQGAINACVLRALGPSGYLVNVARGALVDEDALLHALATGGIAGAALDVFQNEPAIDARWVQTRNTVLTPHIGSAVPQVRAAMAALVLDNLDQYFRDGTVLTPVPG